MRIAICDDEEAQRQLLSGYLHEWATEKQILLETVHFHNAESFLFEWEEDKGFDLLVLDIEMGSLSGIDLAITLRDKGEEVPILFITGYESYMAQGYEVAALHYLLKPVHKEKLFAVLERLQKIQKLEEKILFQTDAGVIPLVPSDIWYLEAVGHQCMLMTGKNSYQLRMSIGEGKKYLENVKGMVSCHRSFLVNVQRVSSIVKGELILDDSRRIPVSRSCAKLANSAFIKYYE